MQKNTNDIVIFLIIVSLLILSLVAFIVSILYLYRRKQISFLQSLEEVRLNYERTLMATQLEIQESTFQHISREIHDNINLSLTLAKLQLNTLNLGENGEIADKINSSIELVSQSIGDLSDISKSLNADIIKQQGLLKAIDNEVRRIRQVGLFSLDSILAGDPVYLDSQKELIIFRIVQEAFNNIIKHAQARHVELSLYYDEERLYISIGDDGKGFDPLVTTNDHHAGLQNITARIRMLGGTMNVSSFPNQGTTLSFNIPFK